ncbi:hypothetical protein B0H63DRAFT_156360 [Podospora didyma]|uniref:FAD-binding PCMH-type domain-containing protein n=1 Tax=Podospora didyma TaxID=330526 RepID=A0AAE0NTC5_9PEZI|nr:hypothetical protein B0H63DRAFT_156360 [Podospora didyma]
MARFSVMVAAAAVALQASANPVGSGPKTNAAQTCSRISSSISSASGVIYAANASAFAEDTSHYFLSSGQTPACVLEVGSPADLSAAIRIIGNTRTPFAVQSGGHASNQGFSSTTGVHISLRRMKQVTLSADKKTVEIGFGQGWAGVYKILQGSGVNVVGGRVAGPGVGGFTLGGGFSWKTNQFGLTADTVKKYNIVLPDGTITQASAKSNPDLFWALKGGMNRFGIVTSAEFFTHPQTPTVYGGLRYYPPTSIPAVLDATTKFLATNKDPKAVIITTIDSSVNGTNGPLLFFYDGPEKPDAFKIFDDIYNFYDTVQAQPFSDFVSGIPPVDPSVDNIRGGFHTFSTSALTSKFLQAIYNETVEVAKVMELHGANRASYDIEPFTRYGKYATDSAFHHANSPLPLNLFFSWKSPSEDQFWYNWMRQSVARLKKVAIQEGIYTKDLAAYPNYSLASSTAEELYGPLNALRLRLVRSRIDPQRVMDLAGGFNI